MLLGNQSFTRIILVVPVVQKFDDKCPCQGEEHGKEERFLPDQQTGQGQGSA